MRVGDGEEDVILRADGNRGRNVGRDLQWGFAKEGDQPQPAEKENPANAEDNQGCRGESDQQGAPGQRRDGSGLGRGRPAVVIHNYLLKKTQLERNDKPQPNNVQPREVQ